MPLAAYSVADYSLGRAAYTGLHTTCLETLLESVDVVSQYCNLSSRAVFDNPDVKPTTTIMEASQNTASGFEVDGLLRAQSPAKDKKPALERHISHIPKDDREEDHGVGDDYSGSGNLGFKDKLKNTLKKTVSRDSRGERPESAKSQLDQGSGLEATGLMRMDSNVETAEDANDKPSLLRKVTKSPQHEEQPRKPKSPSKLERTISSIPLDDYDSDGERPL